MAETTSFTIGADTSCSDGACGKVTCVVVDPVARALTHLVVEPRHRYEPGLLVPLALVDRVDATTGEIRLSCTLADFDQLHPAEETQFLSGPPGSPGYDPDHPPGSPGDDPDHTPGHPGYAPDQVLWLPYYGAGMGMGLGAGLGMAYAPLAVTYDTVPLDEVEVRRGEHVHATDGRIGKVQGLVIDPGSHHVTHVLLQEGHLWGRKEVAIPIGAVTGTADGIQLNLTKRQVEDLPPVDIHHPVG